MSGFHACGGMLLMSRNRNGRVIIVSIIVLAAIALMSYQAFLPGTPEYQAYLVLSELAKKGDPANQRLLAEYFYNKGDFKSSFDWEQKAAEGGDAGAQNFMGYYFSYGINNSLRPPSPDYARAREWFEKAAAQDFPSSHIELCEIYSKGLGVAADHEAAYFWCSLSESTDRAVKFRELSRAALDEEGRQRVENRVATWIGAHGNR
jgi:TPR repeat protein